MSTPLKDFRLGVTEAIDMWLDIEASARGIDKIVVGREVLAEWAKAKAHAHRVASRKLAANGLQPDLDGLETEDAGAQAGKGRR